MNPTNETHNLNASNSEKQKSKESILNRVTSSVSGLLSNVSWSEWISSKKQEEPKPLPNFSQADHSVSKTFHQYNKSFVPIHTPSTSTFLKSDLVRHSNFLPTTSSTPEAQNGNMALPVKDNLELLKKSLCDTDLKSPFAKLNGSLTSSSGPKKRTREQDLLERSGGAKKDSSPSIVSSLLSLSTPVEAPVSKRPRFNISSFGTPYSRKNISTPSDASDSSPYYPGKVTYGGAFNHHKSKSKLLSKKVTPRAHLTPYTNKRLLEEEDGGLGSAAKRILSCIDKISTPLSNSKKIPVWSKRDLDGSAYVADFHKHRPSLRSNGDTSSPPINRLLTPGKAKLSSSIPSLLNKSTGKDVGILNNTSKSSQCVAPPPKEKALGFRQESPTAFILKVSEPLPKPPVTKPLSPKSSQPMFVAERPTSTKSFEIPAFNKSLTPATASSKGFSFSSKSEPIDSSFKLAFSKAPLSTATKTSPPKPELTKQKQVTSPSKIEASSVKSSVFVFSEPEIIVSDPPVISSSYKESKFSFKEPLVESSSSSGIEAPIENFGNAFTVEKGSWECSSCLLQNKASASTCVACQTSKTPCETSGSSKFLGSSQNWSTNLISSNESSVNSKLEKSSEQKISTTVSTTSSVSSGFTSSWGDKFKPAEDTWECDSCLVQNKTSVSSCVACQSAKPAPSGHSCVSSDNVVSNWGDKFKPKEGCWECSACMVQNNFDSSSCVACKTAKPGSTDEVSVVKSTPFGAQGLQPSSSGDFKFGLGSTMSSTTPSSESEWDCETCLVRNKSTAVKCVCCETPKDKSSSNLVSEALTGNFKFGASSSASNSTFNFGIPKSTNATESDTKTFSFGIPAAVSTNEEVKEPSPFLNCDLKKTDSSVSTPAVSSFMFGSTTTPASKPEEVSSMFKFGASPVEAKDKPVTETPLSILPAGLASVKEAEDEKISSTFTFGAKLEEKKIDEKSTVASSSLAPFASNIKSSQAPSLFSFGGAKTTEKSEIKTDSSSLFTFGSKKPAETQKTTSLFSFGSAAPAVPNISSVGPAPMAPFGSMNEPKKSIIGESKPSFEFQKSSIDSSTFAFGSKTNGVSSSSSLFPDSGINKIDTKSTPVLSGSADPSPALFNFGKTQPPTEFKPNFGSANTNPLNAPLDTKADSIFSFGGAPATKPNPKTASAFSFGKSPAPSGATFSFGGAAPSSIEQPPSFGFSKPTNEGFNFGGNMKPTANFSFGSETSTDKPTMGTANFSFGSNNATDSSAPFGFSQQQPSQRGNSAPGPTFQNSALVNSNPFNVLSSGTPSSAGPQRRIKKAIRRNK